MSWDFIVFSLSEFVSFTQCYCLSKFILVHCAFEKEIKQSLLRSIVNGIELFVGLYY